MNRQITLKKMQSGFTLVEIAIVLVIIGLLLGGVLKGTELIESAKVKRAVGEVNGVTAALYAYQDRYKRLPGDDGALAALKQRGGSWNEITVGGNNNGVIGATLAQTFNPGGESLGFWQHLKAAGFITGKASDAGINALPKNAFGGLIGITTDVNGVGAAPVLGGRIVCLSQVPGKSAAAIDIQLDDGNGNTGKIRSIAGTPGVNTAPSSAAGPVTYVEDTFYTLCQQI
jgi:prepilin-type N-terminal cleavage/methylation domain-containing protein